MKNPLKTLRNKADRLYQQSRDPKTPCEHCGKSSQVLHHFFPKSVSSNLRYDLNNAIPLCNGCHLRHHTGDPAIHATVIEYRGQGWYDELLKKRYKLIKVNKAFYEEAIARLDEKEA